MHPEVAGGGVWDVLGGGWRRGGIEVRGRGAPRLYVAGVIV